MTDTAASAWTAVIADDHAILRHGLRTLLERVEGVTVVGEAEDGLQAIAETRRLRPSLLLLDQAMPLAQGLDVLVEVRRWSPATKVAMLTGLTGHGLLRALIAAGVDGLFLKRGDDADLIKAIPRILRGERVIADEVRRRLAEAAPVELTQRELQILSMLASGSSNVDIANRLHISRKTVDNHRTNLMRKLGVHSIVELVAHAVREGLIDSARQI